MKILRESLDARRGREPRFRYAVEASVGDILGAALLRRGWEPASRSVREPLKPGSRPVRGRVVVIGFGPCGIFAALTLARQGYRPLVLERGPSMAARERDFARLQEEGILNPEGNVCFGEGGAGAFSDGKLTARSKDPRVSDVMETLVAHGADPSIPYAARPHLGTENVRKIVCSIREEIIRLGGEIQFDAKCWEITLVNGEIASVIYEQRGTRCRVETNCVILAIGHSARDTYSMLLDRGIAMEQKPFAMGVRVEHPREFIDERQFGRWAGHPRLGAASYQLAAASGGRGVYSFCMCPGGEVVCSATEPGTDGGQRHELSCPGCEEFQQRHCGGRGDWGYGKRPSGGHCPAAAAGGSGLSNGRRIWRPGAAVFGFCRRTGQPGPEGKRKQLPPLCCARRFKRLPARHACPGHPGGIRGF